MRASLLRRLCLSTVMVFAIILLTPAPLLADSAAPWVFGIGPVLVVGLIPVILIEGLVLRRRLGLEWGRALGVTAVANLVSTVIGIAGMATLPSVMPYRGGAPLYLGLLLLLVPLFFVSWLVEYPVAWLMLRPGRAGSVAPSSTPVLVGSEPGSLTAVPRPRPSLLRGMFDANVASYVFLAMVVGVFWVQGTFDRKWYGPPIGGLRTINTAEITYAETYNTGYSSSLSALAPSSSGNPTAQAAGLIDSVLASGEKSGYRFVYLPGRRDKKGRIDTYTVTASPIKPGVTGDNYYYTDQTGVIRQNSTGPASATDSPLAG